MYGGQRHSLTDQKEYCIEAAGNCSAVTCHAFQAQVFSHKDSALLYGDGSCFNAMVGITRSKVIYLPPRTRLELELLGCVSEKIESHYHRDSSICISHGIMSMNTSHSEP